MITLVMGNVYPHRGRNKSLDTSNGAALSAKKFLIATASRIEIAVTHSKERRKHFLIATRMGVFTASKSSISRWLVAPLYAALLPNSCPPGQPCGRISSGAENHNPSPCETLVDASGHQMNEPPYTAAIPSLRTSRTPADMAIRVCATLTLLLFALLAGALPSLARQSSASGASEIQAHLQKAADYLRTNDTASAGKEFEAVLALDPKNADAYANLGVIAFSKGDYRTAAQNLREALAINPSLTKSQALLGICEHRLGEKTPARLA